MSSVQLHLGDCLEVMAEMEPNSIDSIITDPPYGLSFMGKHWDHGVPGIPFWEAALRVAKPGAMLLAFGGTRTFHRLTCAIEDAGWEIRDVCSWLYGSGFPKSHDISKAIDKAAGAEREVVGPKVYGGGHLATDLDPGGNTMSEGWQRPWRDDPEAVRRSTHITAPATPEAQQWHGWGTALKPSWEPIILAMKPLDGTFAQNALKWGVAGLNVDGGRIDTDWSDRSESWKRSGHRKNPTNSILGGLGGTGIDTTQGRWPANLLLNEEAAALLDAQSGELGLSKKGSANGSKRGMFGLVNTDGVMGYGDTGGASRFFYVAKASRAERNAGLEGMEAKAHDDHNLSSNACARCGLRVKANGSGKKCECGEFRETVKLPPSANHHPTVKPLALMRYLCRLTATPTGGIVLDPFMGSGSTGCAAVLEGRSFIGIELEPEYLEIAKLRIEHAGAQMQLPLLEMT